MSKQDREKLTDVLRNTGHPLRREVDSFEEAYPAVADVHMEVTESELGTSDIKQSRTFTISNFRHAINCSNSFCYGGGVELGLLLHDMVRSHQTELDATVGCAGYEGSAKGQRRYRDCLHSFRVVARVEYKRSDEALAT